MDAELLFSLYMHGRRAGQTLNASHKEKMFTGAVLRLSRDNEYTVTDLAGMLSTNSSTMSEKITQLENDGLISRKPSLKDKRAQIITLTVKGKHALDEMIALAHENCMVHDSTLTAEEHQILEILLKKLLQVKA